MGREPEVLPNRPRTLAVRDDEVRSLPDTHTPASIRVNCPDRRRIVPINPTSDCDGSQLWIREFAVYKDLGSTLAQELPPGLRCGRTSILELITGQITLDQMLHMVKTKCLRIMTDQCSAVFRSQVFIEAPKLSHRALQNASIYDRCFACGPEVGCAPHYCAAYKSHAGNGGPQFVRNRFVGQMPDEGTHEPQRLYIRRIPIAGAKEARDDAKHGKLNERGLIIQACHPLGASFSTSSSICFWRFGMVRG